ncbi:hypothetical protein EXIGLDRAFT_763197 [Exidia glandulosa HHB12029]|uniref:Uncharacterized protein n=1 Tax=Exidia glandulosa HHB12029 TaxID=1314781 RepID=A0A165M3P4_EXIGL|nr:hypothetical protein EXIGLDRAFT_763197 [Exidia glandulosa HHB12029]
MCEDGRAVYFVAQQEQEPAQSLSTPTETEPRDPRWDRCRAPSEAQESRVAYASLCKVRPTVRRKLRASFPPGFGFVELDLCRAPLAQILEQTHRQILKTGNGHTLKRRREDSCRLKPTWSVPATTSSGSSIKVRVSELAQALLGRQTIIASRKWAFADGIRKDYRELR